MKPKLFVIILAAIVMATAAGCSNNSGTPDPGDTAHGHGSLQFPNDHPTTAQMNSILAAKQGRSAGNGGQ